MTVPFSVQLKLDRAKEHLQALDDAIGDYLNSDPHAIVRNIQPSDQRLVLFEFQVRIEPGERLGLIIGDCVQNVRSALDHLACRLVEANGGTVDDRTQFPILGKHRTDKQGHQVLPTISGGVNPSVLALVGALQPYQRGNDTPNHPLSILKYLSNTDKHRFLHLAVARTADTRCSLMFPNGSRIDGQVIAVADHETPLLAIRLPEPYSDARYGKVQVEADGSAFVALKDPGPWSGKPVTILLNEILDFVQNRVVAALYPFLD
jgi:hypothetical protein